MLDSNETVGADNGVAFETGGSGLGEICGAVIDKKSGTGFVCVSDQSSDYVSPRYQTGPSETGYVVVEVKPGQTCMRYGSCAVLYIRRS